MKVKVKVHDKFGKVLCKISVDEETQCTLDVEEWAWDTAQHMADELKKICQAAGAEFADKMDKALEEESQNPGWWQKLKRKFTRDRYLMELKVGDYPCPTCLCDTIQPVSVVAGLPVIGYSVGNEVVGYVCDNPNCPMCNVVIPRILVDRIDDRP